MEKLIVTLIGRDAVGIIAKVCTYFAENRINILDISETTLRDILNMVMIVDISPSGMSFEQVRDGVASVSKKVKCQIDVIRDSDLDGF